MKNRFILLEAEIFSMEDSYCFSELESIHLQLGYKIKLISVLDGNKHFMTKQPMINLSGELLKWLKELQVQKRKDTNWLSKMEEHLYNERIFDFQTLFELPPEYYEFVRFDTPGLKHDLKKKKESFQSSNNQLFSTEEMSRNDENPKNDESPEGSEGNGLMTFNPNVYKRHKYRQVPDIKPLFKKGRGHIKSFKYFAEIAQKKASLKDIEIYKAEIYGIIKRDINNEQFKIRELKPPFDILKNAGIALVETFPGLVEHLYPDDYISFEEKQDKVLDYLIRKNNANIPQGVLFEMFYYDN